MTPELAVVIGSTITAAGAVVVAIITTRRHGAALADNTAKTEQVLEQVANDHGTNLRHDVDAALAGIAAVEATQGQIGAIVGKLARDIGDALRHISAHDIASALVVDELRRRDDQIAADLRTFIEAREDPSAGDAKTGP
jgi:hypothetical protein